MRDGPTRRTSERPRLGLAEFEGSRDNNILGDEPIGPVFVDPITPLPGFAFDDCAPISEAALDAPVRWTQPLSRLKGATLHAFRLGE
jgi:hypothetical protein